MENLKIFLSRDEDFKASAMKIKEEGYLIG